MEVDIRWVGFLIAYFILLMIIGYYASRKAKKFEDYTVAGRRASSFHLSWHFAASYISAASVVGLMSYQYEYGWSFLAFYTSGMAFGWLLLHILSEHFRKKVVGHTTADFFAERYYSDKLLRFWIAINYIWLLTVYMVIQYMGIGRVSEVILGLPYFWATLIVGLVVTIYVALGGAWSVLYTDIYQALIMWIGVVIMAPVIVALCGGFTNMNARLAEINPALLDITAGGVFPPVTIAHFFILGSLATASQAYYHRMFYMAPDKKRVKSIIGIGGVLTAIFYIAIMIGGVGVRVLAPGIDPEMAFPYAVKNLLPVGLSMIIIGAVYAAIMSTVDTILLTVGIHVSNDFIGVIKPISEKKKLILARLSTLAIGLVALVMALIRPAGIMSIYIFYGVTLPSFIAAPLFAGYFWKRATKEGAIASSVAGLVTAILWHGPLKQPFGIPTLFVSLPVSVIILIVVSLLTSPPPQRVVERFFKE